MTNFVTSLLTIGVPIIVFIILLIKTIPSIFQHMVIPILEKKGYWVKQPNKSIDTKPNDNSGSKNAKQSDDHTPNLIKSTIASINAIFEGFGLIGKILRLCVLAVLIYYTGPVIGSLLQQAWYGVKNKYSENAIEQTRITGDYVPGQIGGYSYQAGNKIFITIERDKKTLVKVPMFSYCDYIIPGEIHLSQGGEIITKFIVGDRNVQHFHDGDWFFSAQTQFSSHPELKEIKIELILD